MSPRATGFILNVCLTGMLPRRATVPHVPLSPEEIAADCEACVSLGASMFHIHARDDREEPEWRTDRYSDILAAVRARCPDAVLCVTTSGRRVQDVERRAASLDATPKPDMGSLTLGSMNFLREASMNAPDVIEALARAMQERGIVPELEIFDVGMARYARHLADRGVLRAPFYANIILGNVATAGCTPSDLAAVVKELPPEATWCVAGIGSSQLPANLMGIIFGNGARVGLEDNVYLEAKEPASNPALVRRLVEISRLMGREPVPPADVRRRLGLPAPTSVST